MDLVFIRVGIVLILSFAAYFFHPAGFNPWIAALGGLHRLVLDGRAPALQRW